MSSTSSSTPNTPQPNTPQLVFLMTVSRTKTEENFKKQLQVTEVTRTLAAAQESARGRIADDIDDMLDKMEPPFSPQQKARWKDNCIKTNGWRCDSIGWFMKMSSQDFDLDYVARVNRYEVQG